MKSLAVPRRAGRLWPCWSRTLRQAPRRRRPLRSGVDTIGCANRCSPAVRSSERHQLVHADAGRDRWQFNGDRLGAQRRREDHHDHARRRLDGHGARPAERVEGGKPADVRHLGLPDGAHHGARRQGLRRRVLQRLLRRHRHLDNPQEHGPGARTAHRTGRCRTPSTSSPTATPGWQPVRFTFEAGGKTSDFQVYDFYVDPHSMR